MTKFIITVEDREDAGYMEHWIKKYLGAYTNINFDLKIERTD